MKDSTTKLIEDTVEEAAINTLDVVVSGIDQSSWMFPLLSIARWIAKSVYGNAIKLRVGRAEEFLNLVKENISVIAKGMIDAEQFQDWFVLTLEAYIRQRNVAKRLMIQKIFLWYWSAVSLRDFELERLLHTTNIIGNAGIKLLWVIYTDIMPAYLEYIRNEILPQNLKDYDSETAAMRDLVRRFSPINHFRKLGIELPDEGEGLWELESLGIVSSTESGAIGWGMTLYNLTWFWHDFLNYIVSKELV